MSDFKEEFDKRLRRVCGVTDDTKRVDYEEELDGGSSGCDRCDIYDSYDFGASYEIDVYVYNTKKGGRLEVIAHRSFYGMSDLMRALNEVEL